MSLLCLCLMLDEIRGVGGHVVCLPWWFLHSAGCRSFSRVLVHCCILFHWAHGPFTVVKSVQMHSLWCRFVCLSNLLAACSLCCHLSFYISLLMYLFFFCFVYFISFPFSFLLSFPVTFLLPFISLYLYFYISSFIILPFLFCLFHLSLIVSPFLFSSSPFLSLPLSSLISLLFYLFSFLFPFSFKFCNFLTFFSSFFFHSCFYCHSYFVTHVFPFALPYSFPLSSSSCPAGTLVHAFGSCWSKLRCGCGEQVSREQCWRLWPLSSPLKGSDSSALHHTSQTPRLVQAKGTGDQYTRGSWPQRLFMSNNGLNKLFLSLSLSSVVCVLTILFYS